MKGFATEEKCQQVNLDCVTRRGHGKRVVWFLNTQLHYLRHHRATSMIWRHPPQQTCTLRWNWGTITGRASTSTSTKDIGPGPNPMQESTTTTGKTENTMRASQLYSLTSACRGGFSLAGQIGTLEIRDEQSIQIYLRSEIPTIAWKTNEETSYTGWEFTSNIVKKGW